MRIKNILIPKLIQPVFSGGDKWKNVLEQIDARQTQEKIFTFRQHTVLPAMRELSQELN